MHTGDATWAPWSHAHRATRAVILISLGKPLLFSSRELYKEPLLLTCKEETEKACGPEQTQWNGKIRDRPSLRAVPQRTDLTTTHDFSFSGIYNSKHPPIGTKIRLNQ